MKIVNKIDQLRSEIRRLRNTTGRTGFVPTMGALHHGHLSLVEHSRQECDHTIVSIFVNPTQFSPNEDLDKYPRTLEQDFELLRNMAVDLIFVPDRDLMYPPGFSTMVEPPEVARVLEAEYRPEHFKGVTTVVLKLFNLVQPDVAYFGQKDYQQALVIKTMVKDLNVDVDVKTCPIIREPSGLAMSSRNRYLDPTQRKQADAIFLSLQHAENIIRDGENDGHVVNAELTQFLIDHGIDEIDYAVLVDPNGLKPLDPVSLPAVALVAAHVGKTRLIDNLIIE